MIKTDKELLEGKKFIDLFAGIGGFRIALESLGAECVYSNEWDKFAQQSYFNNFGEYPDDDITQVDENKYLIWWSQICRCLLFACIYLHM
jgi:DNA (cytosine-5)-methyltransferase 1